MKKTVTTILLVTAFITTFDLAKAQQLTESAQPREAAPEIMIPEMNPNRPMPSVASAFANINLNLESVGDLQTILAAVQSAPPVPLSTLPRNQASGTFWSLKYPYWPPLPGIIHGEDVWPIGNGGFIIDDRLTDYAELQAEADAMAPSPMLRMSMMASSLSTAYAYGNPVYLTGMAASLTNDGSITANFSIGGGTNFVPYDILMSTNLMIPVGNWNWLGIGYTSNNYSFYEQPANLGFYMLAKPSKTMVVPWGDDSYGQCDIWTGITNAVQVSGGIEFSLVLLNDGTVTGWGYDGATPSELVPTNLAGVAMIASGWQHNVALLTNSTVTAWGDDFYGEINVPAGLTNVAVISAQGVHSLALKTNGTVVAWGYGPEGETNVPDGLTNVTAIAAGVEHNLAVTNGYVVAWGYNGYGQCNVPASLSNVWDVAAGWEHSVALKKDGTVVCWGDNSDGEINVPAGLSNVVAIAAGGDPETDTAYSLALKNDGTVVAWGNGKVLNRINGLSNVIAMGAGTAHALAIRTGPRTPVITLAPTNQYQVSGENVNFTAKGIGINGVAYQWQTNGVNISGATGNTLSLTNVQALQQTAYDVVLTDNGGMGSITSSNANLYLVTAPVIYSQTPMPTNQLAPYQSSLTLSVAATASGQYSGFPLYYQWQLNGTNISGANSNNYTLLVDTPALGAYSVIITNASGSITSLVWQVTMTFVGSYMDVGTLAYNLSTNAVAHTNGISNIYNGMQELEGWQYGTYSGTNMARLTNSVWSTNFWLNGVQGLSATCIGFSNGLAAQGSVTMISPRHCIYANHMHLPPGYFMAAFLDTNNVIYWRSNKETINVYGDTSVGILDSDLPASVGYLPVLPTNYASYLPTNGTATIQGIGRNQDVMMFGQPLQIASTYLAWNVTNTAPYGLTTNWNKLIRGGDSSNPEMLLVGNQLVLVSHNFSVQSGPNYVDYFDLINQKMHYLSTNNNVGTDYKLTSFQLTNWTVFH